MYAEKITGSMERAIRETNRRRAIQSEYNERHGIIPKTVIKGVRDVIDIGVSDNNSGEASRKAAAASSSKAAKMTKKEREAMIERLTKEMKDAARRLEFEQAAYLRDRIKQLRENK